MSTPYFTFPPRQATRRREPWARARLVGRVIGQGLILLFCLAALYACTVVASPLFEPVEPETRCWDTAVKSERYCKTQNEWSIE